jgi:hypothetical protein
MSTCRKLLISGNNKKYTLPSNITESYLYYKKPVSCLLAFNEWFLALTKEMGTDITENTPANNLTCNTADMESSSNDMRLHNVLYKGPKNNLH